jgi:hypothetical protein
MGRAPHRHQPLIKEGVHSAYLVLGLLVGALLDQKLGNSEVAFEHGDQGRRSASLNKTRQESLKDQKHQDGAKCTARPRGRLRK